ncbi:MAG: hypothetical protein WCO25_00580 [Candidatus Uhrbacteria bacterium]
MFDQFFGKPFWITLGALAGIFAVSIAVFPFPIASAVALAVSMVAIFAITWKRLDLGLLVAFAELFANSHGHLVAFDIHGFSLSSRMAVFVGVMAAWALANVTRRVKLSLRDPRLTPFVPLFVAVAIGFAIGFMLHDPTTAFKDGNAYLYLGYLFPVLCVDWDATKKRLLLQVLAASAAWVTILTLGLLYVFTHFPEWMLGAVYLFIRDTRTGELTKMAGNIFRVFLQAQFSVIAFAFFLTPFLFLRDVPKRAYRTVTLLLVGIGSVVIISLSRSFWVGIIAGAFAFVALKFVDGWPGTKVAGKAVGSVVIATLGAGILLVGIVLFPLPYRVGRVSDLTGLVSSRTTDVSDVAISSRWNLLPPLMAQIKEHIALGSGFGQEITFKTDDPRARAIHPDGTWTTYALEWGWLELWLKMGLLGPLAFAFLFVGLVRGLWPTLRTSQSWLAVALISCLAMLYATHVTSPYLNHPLGLGLLLFVVPFLNQKPSATTQKVPVSDSVVAASGALQPSMAPFTSE